MFDGPSTSTATSPMFKQPPGVQTAGLFDSTNLDNSLPGTSTFASTTNTKEDVSKIIEFLGDESKGYQILGVKKLLICAYLMFFDTS